jgi:hypothetical protein
VIKGEGLGLMKLGLATIAAIAGCLALAPSALAGTATYNSTAPMHVFDDSVSTSTVTVPPGRTAVQSVEVTNFRVDWPASGQEMSTQLVGPDGNSLFLFTEGCFTYDEQDVWVFSDSGAQTAPNDKDDPKCDLPGGTFRPTDVFPTFKKLAIFAGTPASGTWTLRATDNGVAFTNQGTIESWAVRIVHAPPTLAATAPAAGKVASLAINATSDANGTVTTGGGAVPATVPLTANAPRQIAFTPTRAVRKKLKKKGKARANVTLAFTDETGGTASATVAFTVKGKKKKPK